MAYYVLGGTSRRRINTDSMPSDRARQTKEWEGTQTGTGTLTKTILWEGGDKNAGQQAKRIQLLSFSFKQTKQIKTKQQTAWYHSVNWWLSHQRPVRVGLHCQANCEHHPWRHCTEEKNTATKGRVWLMWALTSSYCQFWHLGCWQDVLVVFQQNSARWVRTDTAVCRSLFFVFFSRAGHFVAIAIPRVT